MASKASIFKVHIDIANIDQHRYEQLGFTVAQDDRETTDHLVMRLFAYAMVPEERLSFGQGVCSGPDPDVGVKDWDDHYIYWIDVGFPSVERVKKASHQADNVIVFSVNDSEWLEESSQEVLQLNNTHLVLFDTNAIEEISSSIERTIDWNLVIDGNKMGVSDHQHYVESAITRMNSLRAPEMAMI